MEGLDSGAAPGQSTVGQLEIEAFQMIIAAQARLQLGSKIYKFAPRGAATADRRVAVYHTTVQALHNDGADPLIEVPAFPLPLQEGDIDTATAAILKHSELGTDRPELVSVIRILVASCVSLASLLRNVELNPTEIELTAPPRGCPPGPEQGPRCSCKFEMPSLQANGGDDHDGVQNLP